ncbi:hypothetical protein Ccrd_026589 [Cynara cardunculus var. scolymus]|uniref:Uncharacterized protein n=1 Tax=Cynara cardunculus var. scolymus TaxID=59895 RepID=A0A103MUF4_CYNCS|nr:hypothetical protein Ccrd_026589 [Cynara cardunculus var. scolymus]
MSYHDSKSKPNLAKIGADAFALLDDFSGGNKSKPKPWLSKVSVPPRRTPNKLFHYQYQPEEAYVIREQVYVAPVEEMRIETVVDCYEAAKSSSSKTCYIEQLEKANKMYERFDMKRLVPMMSVPMVDVGGEWGEETVDLASF